MVTRKFNSDDDTLANADENENEKKREEGKKKRRGDRVSA